MVPINKLTDEELLAMRKDAPIQLKRLIDAILKARKN